MENEPQMQLDSYNRMPVILEGTSAQLLPESHLRTALFHPSNMDSRMIGVPIEHSSYKDLHSDKNVTAYDDLPNRYNFNYQDLCLPNYDAARESLRAMYPNTASYASSSSIPSSVTHDYENLIGDVNNKWDHNRFLMHMEPAQFTEVQAANEWGLRSQNELCLSLATTGPSYPGPESTQEHCSEMGYSSIYERSSQRSQSNRELSLGHASSSQSAQFPELISGSRYRAVLQQILSEVSSLSLDNVDQNNYSRGSLLSSSSNVPFCSDQFGGDEFRENNGSTEARAGSSHRKQDLESKKSQLLSLLQAVDEQYNRCLDQIHTVISAFHAASDLDPQLHASFALQSVTLFYKNLRHRISNQILEMGMDSSEIGGDNRTASFEKCFIQKQWVLQQSKKKEQQLWRPQRGLPERSVSVLRAWMFDNFLHPYPKDAEKHLLAVRSGLSRSQVSNWFINARVRLWKPLVEEMCSELNRRKGSRQINEGSNTHNNRSNQLSIYEFNQILDA